MIALLDVILSNSEKTKGTGSISAVHGENIDNYLVKNIAVNKYNSQGILFSIKADTIVHRYRQFMQYATYQNLKEIYITNIKLDTYAANNIMPIEGISNTIKLFETKLGAVEENPINTDGDNLDLLTRILFKKIAINMHYSENNKTVITAEKARISLDNKNLVLEEEVKFTSPDKREIFASQAVLTYKFNGIYFPNGYTQDSRYMDKTFFTLDAEGGLSESKEIPLITYGDLISEGEQKLYEQSLKDASPYIKAMLGMPL